VHHCAAALINRTNRDESRERRGPGGMEERGSMYEFYRVLPGTGRELFASGLMEAKDLYRLFRTFANEFMETFGHG
jgi:hypothetical protein